MKYGERIGSGKIVASHRPPLVDDALPEEDSKRPNRNSRCVVSVPERWPNVTDPYRHMFTTTREKAAALDERLTDMGEIMTEAHDIGRAENEEEESGAVKREEGDDDDDRKSDAPLAAVGMPGQGRVCCIGRVCNEVSVIILFLVFFTSPPRPRPWGDGAP